MKKLLGSVILLTLPLGLQGCTLYEGCAKAYSTDTDTGISLTEQCSKGVTYRLKFHKAQSETLCRTNSLSERLYKACAYGVFLQENSYAGRILRPGVDRPETFLRNASPSK